MDDLLEKRRKRNAYIKQYKRDRPWFTSYAHAKTRCFSKGKYCMKYEVKFLMTIDEFKFLWFRDKAYEMKFPTIDRIDPTGDYVLSNCRYLEHGLNSQKNGGREIIGILKNRNSKLVKALVNAKKVIELYAPGCEIILNECNQALSTAD